MKTLQSPLNRKSNLVHIHEDKCTNFNLSFSCSHERVDLTFFNAHKNGSSFNFGDIPVPIQANITGHTYTEILPIHIGEGMNISEIASILPLPDHVLNFTHSDDTVFEYHTNTIHHHEHTDEQHPAPQQVPSEGEEQQYLHLPVHHQHVSHSDLLKIPLIQNSIVIDLKSSEENSSSSSSSSSSEEDSPLQQLTSENGPTQGFALGETPLARA